MNKKFLKITLVIDLILLGLFNIGYLIYIYFTAVIQFSDKVNHLYTYFLVMKDHFSSYSAIVALFLLSIIYFYFRLYKEGSVDQNGTQR
jgi:hypothetical protein